MQVDGPVHASDCSIHKAPAMTRFCLCDCGASTASETFQQSMRLRWNGATGNLEQLWQGSNGSQDWQAVPTVTPDIETQQPK